MRKQAYRGWVQSQDSNLCSLARVCTPAYTFFHLSCNYSLRWWPVFVISPLGHELHEAGTIYFFSLITVSLAPNPVQSWGAASYAPCPVIKRESRMSTQDPSFQSPCNFHHSLKLPGPLEEEHLGIALQKFKCSEKKEAAFELHSFWVLWKMVTYLKCSCPWWHSF